MAAQLKLDTADHDGNPKSATSSNRWRENTAVVLITNPGIDRVGL